MKLEDLRLILSGDLKLIEKVDVNDVAKYEDDVPVEPEKVCKMLKKFLDRKITADELSKWAKFVTLRGEYCSTKENFHREDYYEKMWDVISWLLTPEIDGEITVENVSNYMLILRKYEN